jgi:hypothetical protein
VTRRDLQALARSRLGDAKILLNAGRYDGAYYLLGLAVECGLKACIARRTNRHDFPDKKLALESHTHELWQLIRAAGLDAALKTYMTADALFSANWLVVKDWSVESRYTSTGRSKAEALHQAVNNRNQGVMRWIRQRW